MLRLVKNVRLASKRIYLYRLLNTGRLPKHLVDGRLAYDDEELKIYHKTAKRGRPPKMKENI